MVATQRDIGAYIITKNAFNPATHTAGSSLNDGIEANGVSIDRNNTTPDTTLYLSGKVSIPVSYSLAAAETVTVASNLQHSSNGSTWADLSDKDGSTVASVVFGTTAATAAQTGDVVHEYDVNLAKAKEFVRIQLTTTFSAGSADTADIAGVLVMGGPDRTPAA